MGKRCRLISRSVPSTGALMLAQDSSRRGAGWAARRGLTRNSHRNESSVPMKCGAWTRSARPAERQRRAI
ncbi:hypothetical protein SALBM311S_11351 [Streptomyces alboniger]